MTSLCLFHTLCAPAWARAVMQTTPEWMVHAGATLAMLVTMHGVRYHRVRALLLLRCAAWLLLVVPRTPEHSWKSGAALVLGVALGTGMALRAAEQRARAVFAQEWVQAGVPRRV